MRAPVWLALAMALIAGVAQGATIRQFSYDPANDDTRHAAGALTFVFRQNLVFVTVLGIRATNGPASAELKPAEDKALGTGLSSLIGDRAQERDLYEVLPQEQGKAMIAAFCPGSKHAWLVFGRLRADHDLRVHVLGDNPAGGPARLCRTLDFNYRGEWKLPPSTPPVEREMPQERREPL